MNNNFGDILKELMIINNLSANDIKNISDVNISLIYKWLNNESIPYFHNLIKIADYFNCSIDFLIGRTENFENNYKKQLPLFSSQLKKIMKNKKNSQYRLNLDTHISRETLYNWSIDKRFPNIEHLIRLADYFDCSIDYLIGRED